MTHSGKHFSTYSFKVEKNKVTFGTDSSGSIFIYLKGGYDGVTEFESKEDAKKGIDAMIEELKVHKEKL